MAKKKTSMEQRISNRSVEKKRKIVDSVAAFGMILIAVGLMIPLFNLFDTSRLAIYRWIFAAGSLVYLVARAINVSKEGESVRLKRLRRMEFWAGACFGVAAFFWFYNLSKFSGVPEAGALAILRDTILFSLAGATIQVVASWLIYYREKKEASNIGKN